MTQRPNVAFFPAHPAQLWLMHAVANEIQGQVNIIWILRDKDILIELANKLSIHYTIISKARTGYIGNAIELVSNIYKAINITKEKNIDLWLTKYGAGNIASWLCRKPSISFNDDDIDIVPLIAITSYPFAKIILAPNWTRMGRFQEKTIRFNASNEMIYLHPNRRNFHSAQKPTKKTIFVRLSGLSAHHDLGIKGISNDLILELIEKYRHEFDFIISSEKPLITALQPYKLKLDVDKVHDALESASCVITDSLSMALEAAVLGTPVVRLSDFGCQISAFEAIKKYQLIYNFPPDQNLAALQKIDEILNSDKQLFNKKQSHLLEDMEDPLPVYKKHILDLLRSSKAIK